MQRSTIHTSSPTVSRALIARALIAIVATYLCLPILAKASQQAPPASTAPAQGSAPAPVTPPTNPSEAAPGTDTKKSRKVWTNEDVSSMGGSISVVGDGHGAKGKTSALKAADPQYVAAVRKQLEKLQGQMADADKELASLKNFSEGEPVATADREFHKSYNSQPILQQMTNLETKKKDLQSKIDTLLDEARKKGVEPGQLR